jgi:deazaflavin-dependent oxidoreductase (nitroreductase family)
VFSARRSLILAAMPVVKPPPSWMVRLNVAMLRRGLRLGSQHLLSVRGRKSGVTRSTPVSIATVDGERYIVAAFAEAAWVANVRAAGEGSLTRGRTSEAVQILEVPIEGRAPILRAFLVQVRGGVRFFGSSDPDGIVAAAARYPVFRVVPTI